MSITIALIEVYNFHCKENIQIRNLHPLPHELLYCRDVQIGTLEASKCSIKQLVATQNMNKNWKFWMRNY